MNLHILSTYITKPWMPSEMRSPELQWKKGKRVEVLLVKQTHAFLS